MTDKQRRAIEVSSVGLGLLSLGCLGVYAAIPAILLGHWAFQRPSQCEGRFANNWIASIGLVTGYVAIVLGLVGVFNWDSNQIGNGNRCHLAFHCTNVPMVIVRMQACGQVTQLLDAVGPQTRDKTIEQSDQRH